jgi:sorbitol-6-phosphate 2-dehydrogenase
MGRLEGRKALITGAGQGLGEALAHLLAAEGAAVAIADINGTAAERVAREVESVASVRSVGVTVDVSEESSVSAAFAKAVEALGGLDLLVANAGILKAHDIQEFPLDDWQRVMAVNLTGYFLCAREAARIFAPQKRGVIVQINSKSGKKGSFRNSAYAASKFGGIGLTQSLALDLAPYGVRVNAVCPGNLLDGSLWQDSLFEQYAKKWGLTAEEVRRKYEDQVPLGRGCTYEDVANVVVFLASDDSSYMTGQAINVTGGQQLSP